MKLRETAQRALALYDVYVFLSPIPSYKAFIHTKHVSILSSLLECLAPLVRTSGKLAAGWAAAKLLSLSPATVLAETAQASIVCACPRPIWRAPTSRQRGRPSDAQARQREEGPSRRVVFPRVLCQRKIQLSLYTVSLLSKRHGCASGAKLSA